MPTWNGLLWGQGRNVAPFGVSMTTASCVTLEHIATPLEVAKSAPKYRGVWVCGFRHYQY